MDRREYAHLGIILGVAIVIRALAFERVGLWGDVGFYVADANDILAGKRLFFDIIGRSPLFNYAYAGLTAVLDYNTYRLARVFVVFWWVATIVPIYVLGRSIDDHRAGMLGAALFALAPYTINYGMWVNTLSMAAFFGLTGVVVLDRWEGPRGELVFGICIGCAFLARRSALVILVAGVCWGIVQGLRQDRTAAAVARLPVMLFGGAAGVVMAGYWLAAPPGGTLALAKTHAVDLVATSGRGGFPVVGVETPAVTTRFNRVHIPIFHDVCQLCSVRTLTKTVEGMFRGSVLLVPLAVYLRWAEERLMLPALRPYLFGIIGVLGVYGAWIALSGGLVWRVVVLAGVALAILVLYRVELPETKTLFSPMMVFLGIVVGGFMAAYLYRNRFIHVYYFMDLAPYVAVMAGVIGAHYWRRVGNLTVNIGGQKHISAVAVLLVSVLLLTSGSAMTHPDYINGATTGGDFYTYENLDYYTDFFNDHTDPGEEILSMKTAYVAESHATLPRGQQRIYYLLSTFKDSGPAAPILDYIIAGVRNGTFQWVTATTVTHNVAQLDPELERLINERYCYYDDPTTQSWFQQTGGELWIHENYTDECQSHVPIGDIEQRRFTTDR